MIHDYDKNNNSVLENDEVKKIEDEAFSNLKNYNYFCNLTIGKCPFEVKQVRFFTASLLRRTRVVYSFFVPVQKKIRREEKILFAIYDRTYFCSISINKDGGLAVKGIHPANYCIKVRDNTEKSYYDGSIIPEEILLKKW